MKKLLAVLLTAAMLLTMVPGAFAGELGQDGGQDQELSDVQEQAEESQPAEGAAPAQTGESSGEVPSPDGGELPAAADAPDTVYVGDSGSDESGDGTADKPVATLAKAYSLLKAEGGTIVVCGSLTLDAAADVSGAKAAGGSVTITGGTLKFTGQTDQVFGKETVIENLTVEASAKKDLILYSNESLTIGSNVTFSTPTKTKIYGGSPSTDMADTAIHITMNSGSVNQIWACNTQPVGDVTIDLGGNANVVSHTRCGGKAAANSVTLHVNSDTCSVGNGIYAGAKSRSQGVVNLINIILEKGYFGTKGKGILDDTEPNTTKDIHATIYPDFSATAGFGSYGQKLTGTETNTLTLPGWTGKLPAGMLESYDTVTLTGNSTITCENADDLAGKTITVESSSTLTLSCTQAEAQAANITITGVGTVNYKEEGGSEDEPKHTLDVVYVNGSVETSGDGATADTAVRTLEEAYGLLKAEGGTIVVCGDLTITKDDSTIPTGKTAAVTGEVTITSRYDGTDYNATVTVDNSSAVNLMFGPRTKLEHITFAEPGEKGITLYSNISLTTGEGFVCDTAGAKRYVIYAGQPSKDLSDQDITIRLSSGNYNGVLLGANKGAVGKVTYIQDGTTNIISNLTLGGTANTKPNDIDATINGGYAKVVYDTPRTSGQAGNVTLRLNGGGITEFRDYNKLNEGAASMGNITVYMSPDFAFTGSVGVWTDGNLTTGRKALVRTGYAGTDLPKGAENYNVVNLVGGESVPEGLTVNHEVEDGARLLQIADYQGDLSIDLSGFTGLNISGSSAIRYLGVFPEGLALYVEEGSTLQLSSDTNSQEPAHTGGGTVVLAAPAYSGPEKVVSVDFDSGNAADRSGSGNDGAVKGSAGYVESYDGSKALYLGNSYGEAAQSYVVFPNIQGLDLAHESYTVSFWMRTENGGADRWYGSGDGVKAGSGLAMSQNKVGGVLFSNTDAKTGTDSGFTAAQLHSSQYLTLAMTDANGTQKATDGIRETADGSWYLVTIAVDRDGDYQLYINDTLKASVPISGMKGQALGGNTVSLGADALGQYGIGCAYFDDFTIYRGALNTVDVQASYYVGALKRVLHEMESRLASAGPEYSAQACSALREALQQGQTQAAGITESDYAKARELEAQLRAALEDFLASPDANMTLLLISDIHIGSTTDARAEALRQLFRDRQEADIGLDGILQAGDFADDSSEAKTNAAFDVMAECLNENTAWQMIGCTGNHETQYTSESANYMVSSALYWERMQAYVSDDPDVRKYGDAVLDSVFQHTEVNQGKEFTGAPCFSLTFKGYHFVVVNSDNPGQFADLSKLTNPTVKEALAADPIRHGAWFSQETLDWLDQQMAAYAEDGKPIFVVCHFPFIDTVPLSYFDPIPINDNSIGRQDAEVRSILAKYEDVLYFCGHLHSNMGVNNVVTVTAEDGGSFTEINLPTLKTSVRGYADIPATWYMYVYDTEVVLRGRDALNGKWLTGYDIVIPLGQQEPPVDPVTPILPVIPVTPAAPGTPDTPVPAVPSYADVAGTAWYADAVAYVSAKGLMTGTGATTFAPDATTTRAMIWTVLGRMSGASVDGGEPWYSLAQTWAMANGVSDGTNPNNAITREQLAAMLYRFAGEPDLLASQLAGLNTYADSADVSDWAQEAMAWAVSSGIINGIDGKLVPQGLATRAQVAAMLMRYCENVAK